MFGIIAEKPFKPTSLGIIDKMSKKTKAKRAKMRKKARPFGEVRALQWAKQMEEVMEKEGTCADQEEGKKINDQ